MCVYYFHLDISKDQRNTSVIDFGRSVLGFATAQTFLDGTSNFEVSGVNYQVIQVVSLEGNDQIAIDGDTVHLETLTGPNGREQVRIFVHCG